MPPSYRKSRHIKANTCVEMAPRLSGHVQTARSQHELLANSIVHLQPLLWRCRLIHSIRVWQIIPHLPFSLSILPYAAGPLQ